MKKLWVSLVTLVLLVALCLFLSATAGYRFCGHKVTYYDRYFSHMDFVTHCCVAGRLVSVLSSIRNAQEMYRMDVGRCAPSLEVLSQGHYLELYQKDARYYTIKMTFAGDDWSCSVDKTPSLPGFYLLTSDGAIHFNEKRPATRQDIDLRRL